MAFGSTLRLVQMHMRIELCCTARSCNPPVLPWWDDAHFHTHRCWQPRAQGHMGRQQSTHPVAGLQPQLSEAQACGGAHALMSRMCSSQQRGAGTPSSARIASPAWLISCFLLSNALACSVLHPRSIMCVPCVCCITSVACAMYVASPVCATWWRAMWCVPC